MNHTATPQPKRRFTAGVPVALLALSGAAGCALPISTAAPQSAITVGERNVGVTAYSEFPTVDLLATQTSEDVDDEDYGFAPFPTGSLQVAYGVTDYVDVEAAVDGTLLVVLPIPYGASLGARVQIVDEPAVAAAVAARMGHIGLGVSEASEIDPDAEVSVSATYGSLSGVVQWRLADFVRPGLAVSVMPVSVSNEIVDETQERFFALAASATASITLRLGWLELGPFANMAYFRSPNLRGTAQFPTFGLLLALRPGGDKRRLPDDGPPIPPPPTAAPPAW